MAIHSLCVWSVRRLHIHTYEHASYIYTANAHALHTHIQTVPTHIHAHTSTCTRRNVCVAIRETQSRWCVKNQDMYINIRGVTQSSPSTNTRDFFTAPEPTFSFSIRRALVLANVSLSRNRWSYEYKPARRRLWLRILRETTRIPWYLQPF